MIEIGGRQRTQPAPPAAIFEALTQPNRDPSRPWLLLDEDERPPVPVEEIERLIAARHEARRRRDFAEADRIRDDLAARGVLLEDSAGTTRWKRK